MTDVNAWLETAVVDYLSWMKQNSYAEKTIYVAAVTLRRFTTFVRMRRLPLKEVFTHETLKAFQDYDPMHQTAWPVRRLARHLFLQKQIPFPIQKPKARLPQVYEEYLQFYEQNRQVVPSTLVTTRRILSAFHDELSARGVALSQLLIEHIDGFLSRFKTGPAPATRRQNRSHLRGFLRYLYYNRGILSRDLSRHVVGAINFAHSNPPKFLRPQEIKALFAVQKTYTSWQLRCLAMVHLAYGLGLRPKEISLITLDDILFKKGRIRVVDRKSRNPAVLPLPEEAIKAISAYLVGARPKTESRRLFLTLRAVQRPVTAATVCHDITRFIRKIHPTASAYWLRHTYAQNLLESQSSIFEVKEMLGHDSLNSTRKYLHIHTSLMRKVLFDETL